MVSSRRLAAPRAVPPPTPPPSQPGRDGTRYTVMNVKVLVETENLTSTEHDRIVQWMISRVKSSTATVQKGFVAVVIYDEKYRHILGSDSGGMKSSSSETGKIIGDLFDLNAAAS